MITSNSTPDSGASTSSGVLVAGARAPWRETAVWYEMQHRSECKICSSGYTFFMCTTDKNERELSHNMVPRPLPGQTLTVHYKPHALDGTRTRRHGAEVMRDDDGKVKRIVALTSGYVRFDMPPFAGQIETISIPGSAEKAYILRNFDGARGAELARRLEACYGLDILDPPSGRGSMSKCAAAQGHNCQDDYTKLYPLGMFADDNRFELLQPLLTACTGADYAVRDPYYNVSSYARGAVADVLQHELLPPSARVPVPYRLLKQCDPAWGSNTIHVKTVCAVGCLMSSVSMALRQRRIEIPDAGGVKRNATPGALNAWLLRHAGV